MKAPVAILLVIALLLTPQPATACFFPADTPILVHTTHPDRPFTAYAAGHLGVLQPRYRSMYLVYAYRLMRGFPVAADEQGALVEGWAREQGDQPSASEAAMKVWLETRAALQAKPPESEPQAQFQEDYAVYGRIQSHAFLQAAETARTLAQRWKQHPEVLQEWIRSQDEVFASCGSMTVSPLDPELDKGLPAAERSRRSAEHTYQEAARLFYCKQYPEASEEFQKIGADPGSPYREWGQYLAARSRVRAFLDRWTSTPEEERQKSDTLRQDFTQVNEMLGKVVANPKLRKVRNPARRLTGVLRIRMDPEHWRCELLQRVLERDMGSALEAELIDLGQIFNPASPCPGLKGEAQELELWLRTSAVSSSYSDPGSSARYTAALEQWKKTAHLPWLVTALMMAELGSPGLEGLLEEAGKVPVDSPAGVTVAWYSAHLLRERGQTEAARQRLAAVTPEMTADQISTDNLFRQERMLLAPSWDEVFRNTPRRAAGATVFDSFSDAASEPIEKRLMYFAPDALSVLGPMVSARRTLAMAGSDALSPSLKRQASWAAFARSAVVGDDETLQAAAKALAETEPKAREELLRIVARPTPEDRQLDAQVLLMGLPVVSPLLQPTDDRSWTPGPNSDLIQDASWSRNWWCAPPKEEQARGGFFFVTQEERQTALAEWQKLTEAGNAVSWFSKVAVAWAKAHPQDPRSPVALSRAVHASKRGCGGQNTPEAKAAFRLLHERYGKTEWARRTPYVY